MSDSGSQNPTPESSSPGPTSAAAHYPPVTVIDASCRRPVLLLFAAAVSWFVAALVLQLLTAVKLHAPGFLADTAWLTLGRVRPAGANAFLYGFASQAGLGLLIWMMCRMGRVPLLNAPFIFFSAILWNVAVFVGITRILGGGSTGFEWLEMPPWIAVLLLLAFGLIGIWMLVTFRFRAERHLYVSQWYLFAALFWFVWVYSAAVFLLLFEPVRGVMQAAVNAWYQESLLNLWLAPLGLAAIYYFIPKVIGRPLYSRYVAALGFWTLALFGGWTGYVRLIGGPLPVWMISLSIAMNLLMLVAIVCVGLNWHMTLAGRYDRIKESLTLRFIAFGAACYFIASLEGILLSLRSVSALTEFTYVPFAQTQLFLWGFFAMVAFGGIYYIVPRLTRVDWASAKLVRAHYWCSAAGIGLYFVSLTIGGLVQGIRLNNPEVDFVSAVKSTIPFVGLSTLATLILLAGQLALLKNLCSVACPLTAWRNCCSWLRTVSAAEAAKAEIRA